jgi:hypothetical protein
MYSDQGDRLPYTTDAPTSRRTALRTPGLGRDQADCEASSGYIDPSAVSDANSHVTRQRLPECLKFAAVAIILVFVSYIPWMNERRRAAA